MKKTLKSALLILLCLASMLCIFACKEKPTGLWENATYTEDTKVGKGEKEVKVEITAEELTITLTVKTNEATLGDALYKLELVNNDNGMFDTVNGIKADYSANNSYWAFYDANDGYMQEGIFTTEINGGELYKFVYTIYQGV